jgi:hypothetical protein
MARSVSDIEADLALVRSALQAAYSYKSVGSDGSSATFQDMAALERREATLTQQLACAQRTRITRGRLTGI